MAARILIIDDNEANLDLMAYLLMMSGHSITQARDGKEGFEVSKLELPDLIICDVQMPFMNGYEFAKAARETDALREIVLIAVTAFARESDRAEALQSGFDGYISKPIEPETFVQQIEAWLPSQLRTSTPTSFELAQQAESHVDIRPKATIIVLDNLVAHLDLAASLLEPFGYKVIVSADADEALQLAKQAAPDLILSDMCMPARSGLEFLSMVKADAALASVPFIFITATATTERDRQHGLALGAAKYLFRPIDSQDLLREIEESLLAARDAVHSRP